MKKQNTCPPRKQAPRLPARNSEPTQEDKILEALERANGRWVSMPRLSVVSGSMNIHTRVDGLRSKGFNIINCQRHQQDSRNRDSFYRLVPADEVTPPADPK